MTEAKTKTFGDWLKEKRESRGISQTDLMVRSGVTKGYISNLERNLRQGVSNELVRPSVEVVDKLARALDTSLTEARLAAGYAPPEESEALDPRVDYELEYLVKDSRNWSEENRVEAVENAKLILRRYKEKESKRGAGSKKDSKTQNPPDDADLAESIAEIDREWENINRRKRESSTPPPALELPPPDEEALKDLPHLKLVKGKIFDEQGKEIKKASKDQKPKEK